jgi:hypothetical protein
MKDSAQRVHQEVLEMILALSDDKSSDRGSFVRDSFSFYSIPDHVVIGWECIFQPSTQVCGLSCTTDSF